MLLWELVNVDMVYVFIDNVSYHVFNAVNVGKLNYIVLDINDYRYYLGAPLSIDELMEIAMSID